LQKDAKFPPLFTSTEAGVTFQNPFRVFWSTLLERNSKLIDYRVPFLSFSTTYSLAGKVEYEVAGRVIKVPMQLKIQPHY